MMQNGNPQTMNPLDPAHFAIATHVAGNLQLRAKTFLEPPQEPSNLTRVTQDTRIVDRFGNPLATQEPGEDVSIDAEFREVGRGQ